MNKKTGSRKTFSLVSLILALGICLLSNILFGQVTAKKVQVAEGEYKQSATSILPNHSSYGRFGPVSMGGYLTPNPESNTRLDRGAIFSSSGSFIGYNSNTSNSRFQPYWEQSTNQFSGDNKEYNDLLSAMRYRQLLNSQSAMPSAQAMPQQVQATPPTLNRQTSNAGKLDYYSSGEYARHLQQQGLLPEESGSIEPLRQQQTNGASSDLRNQIWMRGNLPPAVPPLAGNRTGLPVPASGANRTVNNIGSYNSSYNPNTAITENNLGSRMVGSLLSPNLNPNEISQTNPANATNSINTTSQVVPTPNNANVLPNPNQQAAPNTIAAFQEYMELMLMRSPNVNPLSPIQVIFNQSTQTATVRGIVPTQEHRMEAGRILLSDPRVKKVDNKLSILPTKSGEPLPEIFDPNLEKAQGK